MDRANGIGFIGLGAMGAHMLNNLIIRSVQGTAGRRFHFVVCDVNPTAVEKVLSRYAAGSLGVKVTAVQSPREIATKAATIITMVPTSRHVREIYLGENGVLKALKSLDKKSIAQTLCMDESTIEQAESRAVAQEIKKSGAEMVDAPVSGGVVGARDGTLAIMVGGSNDAFQRVQPFLQYMAAKVVHCGELGAGLAAKIANNMLLGITMLGVSEAMLLGKNLGLKPQVLAEIINTSTGHCWSSEVNNPVPEVKIEGVSPPAHRNYEGGFVTKLAHKDLALAVAAGKETNTPLALGTLTEETYRPLAQESSSFNNKDFSSVYEFLESQNKVQAKL